MFKNRVGLLLIISANLLFAQNETQKDKLVLENGAELKGVITFDDSYNTPDTVTILVDNEATTYQPKQVKSFELGKRRYVSAYVEIDQTDQYLNAITTKINEKSIEKHIFLRVVVDGITDFLIYKDTRTHFYATKEDQLLELIRIPRYSDTGKSNPYNKYIGQLTILLSDCLKQEKIDNVDFSFSAIKNIIDAYNVCKNGESAFVESKVPFKINFFLVGGYTFSHYDIKKEVGAGKVYTLSKNSGSPTFGLAFDFNIFKNSEGTKLFNELLYQSYTYETFVRDEQNPDFYTEYTSILDVAYIEFTNSIRFNLGKAPKSVVPFVGLNLTNVFKVKDTSNENTYLFFYDSERNTTQIPFDGQIKKYGISFSASAGLTYKKFSLETRYRFASRLSNYPTISSSSSLNLLLNYKI